MLPPHENFAGRRRSDHRHDALALVLRKSGWAVDHVNNGLDADTAVLAQPYDLLILDLGLPRLSGIDVLRRLRARKSPLPVLVLTAQDGIEDRVRKYKAADTQNNDRTF